MLRSYKAEEGWISPFLLELDLVLTSHGECQSILSLLRLCSSECDPEILYISDEVLRRINDIGYEIKYLDIGDPLIKLIKYTFNYLYTRNKEELFYDKCKIICKTYNYYLKNDPPGYSPQAVSPVSPPCEENKGAIQKLKEVISDIPAPKIMKKEKRR